MHKSKIGVGIVTYKRQDYFERTVASIPRDRIGCLIAVNDGPAYPEEAYKGLDLVIQHETNKGVAAAKNSLLKKLLELGYEHIFLLEDDMQILDENCFDQYVETSLKTGILHFNFGPGSPFNLKQDTRNFDLHNRHELKQDSEPNPKLVINYPSGVSVALYEHTVAMFSYFRRKVLEEVGFIDEQFVNAWEHVDHTHQITQKGYHTPFWWFADVANSHLLMKPQEGAIDNSSIADKGDNWIKNVMKGAELYRIKNGHVPAMTPLTPEHEVMKILRKLAPNV